MDPVEQDAREFVLHVSRTLIELWEGINAWTLDDEHKEVLERHFDNPYIVAQGLDELTFEYYLLWGCGSKFTPFTGAMALQRIGF